MVDPVGVVVAALVVAAVAHVAVVVAVQAAIVSVGGLLGVVEDEALQVHLYLQRGAFLVDNSHRHCHWDDRDSKRPGMPS